MIEIGQVAHTHVERQGGVNIWGYRGPVLHQKKANEIRIAVAGGDMSFGWGVAASESLAPSIRQRTAEVIDRPGTAGALVTSVTLGVRGLVPDDYASWIEHYAYLRPDVLCLVIDPIGHAPSPGPYVPDRRSLAFTRFGYSPILPLVLEERSVTAHSPLMRIAGALLGWADAMLGDGTPRLRAVIAPAMCSIALFRPSSAAALSPSVAGGVRRKACRWPEAL